jgi:hypothetical protein
MGEVAAATAATAGKGFFSSLGLFLKFGFAFFLVIMLFGSAVIKGFEANSFGVFANSLVQDVALASNQLNQKSLDVINNTNDGKFKVWKDFYGLFRSFALVLAWIALFAFIVSKTWSTPINTFVNYSLGFLFFIIFQIVAILINGWLSGTQGTLELVYQSFAIPFQSFINLWKTIPYIISSVKGGN